MLKNNLTKHVFKNKEFKKMEFSKLNNKKHCWVGLGLSIPSYSLQDCICTENSECIRINNGIYLYAVVEGAVAGHHLFISNPTAAPASK